MGPRALIAVLCAVNLLCGVAAGVALDQRAFRRGPPRHRGGGPGPSVERLAEELELTDAQTARVREIFAAREAAFREAMGPVRAAMDQARPRMEALRAETDAQVDQVLTAEQRARFAELRAEAERRVAERRGPRGDGDPAGVGSAGRGGPRGWPGR